MMSHWFNTYQKVEGQKLLNQLALFLYGSRVYQKVDGQKLKGKSIQFVARSRVYQKVDGQKPSISNIGTAGDNDEWLSIND